jgi:hypothetical protein
MFAMQRLKQCLSRRTALVLVFLLAAPGAQLAHAGYVSDSFTFNISNIFGPGNYGTVFAEANNGATTVNGVLPGQVRLTVTGTWAAAYGNQAQASNFGFDKFAFNTDLGSLSSVVVTNNSNTNLNWGLNANQNESIFGKFSYEVKGNGNSRDNPIIVTISNLGANATLAHFEFNSQGGTPVFFAAHIAGFPNTPGSNFIGADPSAVPEPSAVVLALVGIGGFGLTGFRRWRRKAAE